MAGSAPVRAASAINPTQRGGRERRSGATGSWCQRSADGSKRLGGRGDPGQRRDHLHRTRIWRPATTYFYGGARPPKTPDGKLFAVVESRLAHHFPLSHWRLRAGVAPRSQFFFEHPDHVECRVGCEFLHKSSGLGQPVWELEANSRLEQTTNQYAGSAALVANTSHIPGNREQRGRGSSPPSGVASGRTNHDRRPTRSPEGSGPMRGRRSQSL